jgi:hypothetical protein
VYFTFVIYIYWYLDFNDLRCGMAEERKGNVKISGNADEERPRGESFLLEVFDFGLLEET